jgi:structural maintenance of chromosome 1
VRCVELNVLVKARNFLVFQGDVEAIASKSPKDFTAMLEEISGSNALARRVPQDALEAKRVAEESTLFTFQKKKGINAEKKRFKEQKDEAEKLPAELQQRIVSLKQAQHALAAVSHQCRARPRHGAEARGRRRRAEARRRRRRRQRAQCGARRAQGGRRRAAGRRC